VIGIAIRGIASPTCSSKLTDYLRSGGLSTGLQWAATQSELGGALLRLGERGTCSE
jgi:hypothetical protein